MSQNVSNTSLNTDCTYCSRKQIILIFIQLRVTVIRAAAIRTDGRRTTVKITEQINII
jgi:hypothetical protein